MGKNVEKLREYYLPFLSTEEEEYAKLNWEDATSHRKRFEIFASSVPLDGKSLLDVGCGIGSLFRFLESQNVSCNYTGIDALPEMVALATKLSPQATFIIGDPFEEEKFTPNSFEVVFASGIFNLHLEQNEAFLYEAIAQMRVWAKEYIVFNALHCRSCCQESTYHYYDPQEILLSLRQTYSDTVYCFDDYLANDFTIVMTKLPFESQ